MEKSIFASTTFWGVVAAIVGPFVTRYGIDAQAYVPEAVAVAGGLFAIYGRFRASRPVKLL